MKTIIVWYRNDLRLSDHPALITAVEAADVVVPVFIFNDSLLTGHHSSANRNRFLLECLSDLKHNLQAKGSDLLVRSGQAEEILVALANELEADEIYYSADYTPHAIKRDKAVKAALESAGLKFRGFPGRLAVSSLENLKTKAGTLHKVFTPFYKNWLQIERRQLAVLPDSLTPLATHIDVGNFEVIEDSIDTKLLSPDVLKGGETAARKRLTEFLDTGINTYQETNNNMSMAGTSRLSSYLHFGCLSPLEIETLLPQSTGAEAWRRQLAWREFYHYILFFFPNNAQQEFQERFRSLKWEKNETAFVAWALGKTGYPVVDAAMRQLLQEGWMHNRSRLIVGSFLTKDLGLDWRLGEQHFMRWLIDGDEANNNGNWQWIASVGVDPAPVFRRLYNPTLQQLNYDPDGSYVRKFVPELNDVPDKYLAEPWTTPAAIQQSSNCLIGRDYPAPIVDHKLARVAALDRYREASASQITDS
ncbi:MAG: deoxyribodipyrimidine photo-lyase [Patescibacteria group bacterium]|nr:deoxyribodipyrimidine photo-lyase [Patescibacteria group bacterium]